MVKVTYRCRLVRVHAIGLFRIGHREPVEWN